LSFLSYANGETIRQTDRHTHRNAIGTTPGGKANMYINATETSMTTTSDINADSCHEKKYNATIIQLK